MFPLGPPLHVAVAAGDPVLQCGDIVAVVGQEPQTVVLHRVIAIAGDRVILRGDTNFAADPPVAQAAIIGQLVAVKLGPVEIEWPRSGAIGWMVRRGGQQWAQVAPTLRQCARWALGRRRFVDTGGRSGTV